MPLKSCTLLMLALVVPLHAQAPNAAPGIPSEIEVDGYCRIVSVDLSDPAKPHVRRKHDDGVCRIDGGVHRSITWEKQIRNGVGKEVAVVVIEREFLLHNPYPQPVTFVVKQPLDKNFHVDSDPQPNEVAASVATFRVAAEPNQTVRLHVGERN